MKELGYLALAIVLAELYVAMTSRLLSDFRLYLLEYYNRQKCSTGYIPTINLQKLLSPNSAIGGVDGAASTAVVHRRPAIEVACNIVTYSAGR